MQDTPLPECPEEHDALTQALSQLKLRAMPQGKRSDFWEQIAGRTFRAEQNRTGITSLSLTLGEQTGVLTYVNAQGKKELPFGIGKNEFTHFPEYAYSDEYGGLKGADDFMYRCAASLGFVEAQKCVLRVQILDRYLGNLTATLAFKDKDTVCVHMEKCAEDFLDEYEGEFVARAE